AVAGDIAAGEKTFKKCMPCHSIGEAAKNGIGPIQNGLKGRKSGSMPGYSYSDANKNSGIVWDEATFKEYIKDPKAKIPGTKMVFPGIKDEKDAEDLWSFLEQFGPDGKKKLQIALCKKADRTNDDGDQTNNNSLASERLPKMHGKRPRPRRPCESPPPSIHADLDIC